MSTGGILYDTKLFRLYGEASLQEADIINHKLTIKLQLLTD